MSASFGETPNFIWSTAECLGHGAAGVVYKCRHKQTGHMYAIKTMNYNGRLRPTEVQRREFDVLLKLKHPNIVRLIAVEEELGRFNSDVLIMELCSGKSLYQVLNEPQHAHGLPGEELVRVVTHVAAGMEHLRQNDVVHRDIKPGNILRAWDSNGQAVYKLTDFGAARELKDDENFMSLYGTEEYLHPDMYERAVLHRHQPNQQYGATVDLWSLGVTIYHSATGQLPFQPYGGARRSRTAQEVMYHMTSQKATGFISGVQRTENGPIEWSQTLPANARLSGGLASLLTPMLAGIMECSVAKQWDFEKFFRAAEHLGKCRPVHVFYLPTAALHTVYLDQYSVSSLLDELAVLVEQKTEMLQVLRRDCSAADSETLSLNSTLPDSSVQPLLVSTVSLVPQVATEMVSLPDEIPVPCAPRLDFDTSYARTCLVSLHRLSRLMEEEARRQQALQSATLGGPLHNAVQRLIAETRSFVRGFHRACTVSCVRANDLLKQVEGDRAQETKRNDILQRVQDLQLSAAKMQDCTDKYYHTLVESDELRKKWKPVQSCSKSSEDGGCCDAVLVMCQQAQEIWQRFRDDRNRVQSPPQQLQIIHKQDKQHLYDSYQNAKTKLMSCCFGKVQQMHKMYQEFIQTTYSVRSKVMKLREFVSRLEEDQRELDSLCDQLVVSLRSESDSTKPSSRPPSIVFTDSNGDHHRAVNSQHLAPPQSLQQLLFVDLERHLHSLHETCASVQQAMQNNCQLLESLGLASPNSSINSHVSMNPALQQPEVSHLRQKSQPDIHLTESGSAVYHKSRDSERNSSSRRKRSPLVNNGGGNGFTEV